MKSPIVKLGVVLAVVLGGGWLGIGTYRARLTELEHKLDLERIRREFTERAPLARLLSDPARYRAESQQLFRWYFGELTDHYNRFSSFKNNERFLSELTERKKVHKVTDQEAALLSERYQATRVFWDLLRSGKYEPIFTAGEKGLRFDIYDVQSVAGAKEPLLRFYFALYGAQRRWSTDSSTGARVMRLSVNASFHELNFSGLDAQDKPIREMRANGDPYKIDNPDRFIEDFPPGVVFGYYEISKIPAEVVSAALTFDLSTRSVFTGEEMAGKLVWKLPVPPEWKLPPGVAWEGAQEQVRDFEDDSANKKSGRR